MNSSFNIPVVLFIFKRKEASIRIMERIAQIKPSHLYILSDHGRSEEERRLVNECREAVESIITWPCMITKFYAEENIGVYQNIGVGAMRVFEKEDRAIFLEDDNLPEVSFFQYCNEMLEKYYNDERVLWVCGTNYLGKYTPQDGVDYKFTQHMLPCGWASWGHKFTRFYDGSLSILEDKHSLRKLRKKFESGKLFRMYRDQWLSERKRILQGYQPISWDYQMCLALRANNLLGIVPMYNQIKNIGVDEFSTHGGTTMENIMTQRYCGMDSYTLKFPLNAPKSVEKDKHFERLLEEIIVPPMKLRIRIMILRLIKKTLGLQEEESLRKFLNRS